MKQFRKIEFLLQLFLSVIISLFLPAIVFVSDAFSNVPVLRTVVYVFISTALSYVFACNAGLPVNNPFANSLRSPRRKTFFFICIAVVVAVVIIKFITD